MNKKINFSAIIYSYSTNDNTKEKERKKIYGYFCIKFKIRDGIHNLEGKYDKGIIEYKNKSNNEVKYLSIISGLECILNMLNDLEISCKGSNISVVTDSKVLHNQITDSVRINDNKIQALYEKVKFELGTKIKSFGVNLSIKNLPKTKIMEIIEN